MTLLQSRGVSFSRILCAHVPKHWPPPLDGTETMRSTIRGSPHTVRDHPRPYSRGLLVGHILAGRDPETVDVWIN